MEFEEACSEIYYILEHMNPADKLRIPEALIQFFKDNKSILYKVKLDVTKSLAEQELKDETKAFIQILNAKYFASEEEKQEFNSYLQKESSEENLELPKNTEITVVNKNNFLFNWIKNLVRKIKYLKYKK